MDAFERRALQNSLVRLSQGDRTAFEPVFTALWPLLSKLCGRILGDPALGEDAAQSALLKIFSRADELDPERDAVAWAVGVAIWESKSVRKQLLRRREVAAGRSRSTISASVEASRERTLEASVEASIDASVAASTNRPGNPAELAERRELEKALQAIVGELRPADSEVIDALLHERPIDVPSATFRKRVQRALQRLREIWRARHGI